MTNKTTGRLTAFLYIIFMLVFMGNPVAAKAEDGDSIKWAGSFVVRAHVTGVFPSDKQSLTPDVDTEVSNTIIPEMSFSYFFTDNWAIETICCATRHKVTLTDGTKVGKVWLIPLTVTAQYHFQTGNGFKPYIGFGPHMSVIPSARAEGSFTSLKLKNPRFGVALQIGADYMLNDRWMLNVDVKRLFVNLKVDVNNGAVVGKAKINPWIIGIGAGYKF